MKTSGRRRRGARLAAAGGAVAILAAAPVAGARPDSTTGARAPQEAKVVVVEPGGFDWADAGVGAGVAAGLVLFGAATARIVRRHRHVAAIRPGRA